MADNWKQRIKRNIRKTRKMQTAVTGAPSGKNMAATESEAESAAGMGDAKRVIEKLFSIAYAKVGDRIGFRLRMRFAMSVDMSDLSLCALRPL